jgi:AraC-like DNA-binding protein
MEYVGRVPAPPLDRFIDDIYCLAGVPRYRLMSVPPMPSAHLFVNLGEPARLWDSDPSVPPAVFTDAWFMGVWTRRFRYEYPARVRLVGVHFKPWGMSPFTGTPAAELRDRWVPADAVWQRSADRIRNHLAAQFRSHVGVTPKRVARIYRFARLILSVDAPRPAGLAELAHTAGYFDQAHFSREFKDFTGHTPAEYLALRRRFPAEQGFPPDSGPMPAD